MKHLKFGDPESIKLRDEAEASTSAITHMQASYGVKRGKQCGSCRYFKLESYSTARCTIYQLYGDMRGAWQTNWEACGKWKR